MAMTPPSESQRGIPALLALEDSRLAGPLPGPAKRPAGSSYPRVYRRMARDHALVSESKAAARLTQRGMNAFFSP